MNLSKTLLLALGALVLAACGGGGGGDDGPLPDYYDRYTAPLQSASFVHVTNLDNILGALTTLDHTLVNGNPNARIFVTPIFDPADMVYVNENLLVRYLGAQWVIQCADPGESMPSGASFAVTVATDGSVGGTQFGLVEAVPDSTLNSRAFLNLPAADGNPAAVILLTVNASPGGSAGPDFDLPLSVVYVSAQARWAAYNRTGGAIPSGLMLNYAIAGTDADGPFVDALTHTVTLDSRVSPSSYPDLPYGPDAVVHVLSVVHGGLMSSTPYGAVHHTRGWGVLPQNATLIGLGQRYNMVVALP